MYRLKNSKNNNISLSDIIYVHYLTAREPLKMVKIMAVNFSAPELMFWLCWSLQDRQSQLSIVRLSLFKCILL